jgi:hypothetical protein
MEFIPPKNTSIPPRENDTTDSHIKNSLLRQTHGFPIFLPKIKHGGGL